LAAGATVVGLGTSLFRDPGLPAQIVGELPAELGRRGFDDVASVRGIAHQNDTEAQLELDGLQR
jgi:dihydroorotate dehydrogenase